VGDIFMNGKISFDDFVFHQSVEATRPHGLAKIPGELGASPPHVTPVLLS
jgi:hypothetical protein